MATTVRVQGCVGARRPVAAGCRRQRRAAVAVRAAGGLGDFTSGADFSPEQLQAAMQNQLKKSAEQAAAEAAQQLRAAAGAGAVAESAVPARRSRSKAQASAEEVAATQQQSAATQQELVGRVGGLEGDGLAGALRRQLEQSGTFDEADPSSNGNGAAAAAASNGASTTAAPAAVFEDGTVLFTSEVLKSVNFEDVLTA